MGQFSLQEEVLAVQDESTYHIPNELSVRGADSDDIRVSLEGDASFVPTSASVYIKQGILLEAVESVAESSDAITQPPVFDVYRSLLK